MLGVFVDKPAPSRMRRERYCPVRIKILSFILEELSEVLDYRLYYHPLSDTDVMFADIGHVMKRFNRHIFSDFM